MKLSELQREFLYALGKFLVWQHEEGYWMTGGELYRTPEQCALNVAKGTGVLNSVHTKRLAIDLNLLMHHGSELLINVLDYKPLGAYWKTLHPLARWGGDFGRRDGNHFSFEYEGVQ